MSQQLPKSATQKAIDAEQTASPPDDGLPMRERFGIIYSAKGKQFYEEGVFSARSARVQMPNVGIAMVTDCLEEARAEADRGTFTHVLEFPEPAKDQRMRNLKLGAMLLSPFQKTLYIDTDTYFLDHLYDLIPLLDKFDMALTHELMRYCEPSPMVPSSFPMHSGGMLAYNNNEKCRAVIQEWLDHYLYLQSLPEPHHTWGDQRPWREVLWNNTDIRFYVLPPEYCLHSYSKWLASIKVKIVHCRGERLRRMIRTANRRSSLRVGEGMPPAEYYPFAFRQFLKRYIPKKYWPEKHKGRTKGKGPDPQDTWEDIAERSKDYSGYRTMK